jgi:hypothetical protein
MGLQGQGRRTGKLARDFTLELSARPTMLKPSTGQKTKALYSGLSLQLESGDLPWHQAETCSLVEKTQVLACICLGVGQVHFPPPSSQDCVGPCSCKSHL